MSAELELHQNPTAITEVMDYARAISTASMLPDTYRGKPADIMIAVGLGQAMGLSPAESLYRISVIKGKPTASAELIAANIRKAGHRLRVTGNSNSATATILRADDPEFPFEVTRDMEWAKRMGLADQPNYKKQPGTMLQWRAITAVARLACPEALYGVAYTSDELDDQPRRDSRPGGLASALAGPEPESPLLDTSSALARQMFALLGEQGITEKEDRLLYVSDVVGRQIDSSKELTEDEARAVVVALIADQQAAPVDGEVVE